MVLLLRLSSLFVQKSCRLALWWSHCRATVATLPTSCEWVHEINSVVIGKQPNMRVHDARYMAQLGSSALKLAMEDLSDGRNKVLLQSMVRLRAVLDAKAAAT